MQRAMILVLACLAINGCMDLAVRMEVKPDGSVRGTLKLEMLDQSYQQLMTMAGTMGADLSLLDKDAMEAQLAAYGGTVKNYQNAVEEGVRKIHMDAHVKKGQEWLNSLADGSVVLRKEADAWQLVFLESDLGKTMSTMDKSLVEQQLSMLMPMMSGLTWKVEMVVPELLETNMEKINSSSASFHFDFDEQMADKTSAQAAEAFLALFQPKWVRFKGLQ